MHCNFIGIQKGFETSYDLYNIALPGHAAHGTTFMVPHGADFPSVYAAAQSKLQQFAS